MPCIDDKMDYESVPLLVNRYRTPVVDSYQSLQIYIKLPIIVAALVSIILGRLFLFLLCACNITILLSPICVIVTFLNAEEQKKNAQLYTMKLDNFGTKQSEHQNIVYTWTNINVHTKQNKTRSYYEFLTPCCSNNARTKFRKKLLLKNVSGSARPGELLALMGSSGAGKTTLLNSLTFRSDRTVTETGVRTINGVPVNRKLLTAISAYVQQHELFIGTLTIWEHLVFQALVRMDRHIPYEKRIARVEQVIKDLSLEKCKNSIIGVTGELKGLSGGEMKRLSFASEVLTDPPLIFCDEPTSGLDSFMAHNVIGMLKNMASNGKTIICTIHQPSSEIYYMFDRIMLMASGRTAFFGVPNEAITFFKTLGVGCPKNHNPADFFVQLLAIVPSQELRSCKTIDTVCEEYECSLYKYSEIIYQKKLFSSKKLSWSRLHLDGLQNISSPYKASWTEQLSAVLWRSWLSVKKEPALIVALMMSFFFYDQHLDQDGVISINGAIYLCITVMTYQNMWSVINVFCSELPVFLREHHNGMYRTDVYFLSKTLAEVPLFLIIPVLFTSILYYAVGLNPKFIHFIIAIILISLVSQVAVSVGYLVSCASVNLRVALFMSAVTYMPFMLCGGFFLNIESIPSYFRWLSIFSWYKYANEGLQINQWSDIESIQCSSLNTTCLRTGDDVLKSNSFVYSNIITDIISLLLLIVGFRFLAFLSLLVKTSRN